MGGVHNAVNPTVFEARASTDSPKFKAALLDEECNTLLKGLEEKGSLVLLCGTCLDHFGLTEQLNVGKNACIGDVRESMAMEQVDYL